LWNTDAVKVSTSIKGSTINSCYAIFDDNAQQGCIIPESFIANCPDWFSFYCRWQYQRRFATCEAGNGDRTILFNPILQPLWHHISRRLRPNHPYPQQQHNRQQENETQTQPTCIHINLLVFVQSGFFPAV